MTLVSVSTSLVVLMLLASVVLGWVAELRRTGGAASAQERRDRAGRAGRPPFYTTSAERADAMRERLDRERRRREHARAARQRATAGPAREARADRPPSPPPPPPESPEARHRTTLELGPGPVTEDALRRHYRRLVTAYHPDRVAGLGDKIQRLAEEETKAINEAYAFFKRHLGL